MEKCGNWILKFETTEHGSWTVTTNHHYSWEIIFQRHPYSLITNYLSILKPPDSMKSFLNINVLVYISKFTFIHFSLLYISIVATHVIIAILHGYMLIFYQYLWRLASFSLLNIKTFCNGVSVLREVVMPNYNFLII